MPSSQALSGFLITAPPSVCVPDVIGALACGFQTKKNSFGCTRRLKKKNCNTCTLTHSDPCKLPKKKQNTSKLFPNFLKPLVRASAVWYQDINCNHTVSQDALPSTVQTRAYFKIMRDSLKTNLCLPSSFITHHSALNVMSLFWIHTQSHGAVPTHTYHFEDNMRNLYGDCLSTQCTTNILGCETHAILECT